MDDKLDDVVDEPVDEIVEPEDVDETPVEDVNADPPAAPADELPEKFRGKSAEDIARMHMELERKLVEQGDELGRLRKQKPDEQPVEEKPKTSADLLMELYADEELKAAASANAALYFEEKLNTERRALRRQGFEGDELEAELAAARQELTNEAWSRALLEKADQVNAHRAQLREQAPALMKQDIAPIVERYAAQGITEDELTHALLDDAGIDPALWPRIPAEQKQTILTAAARIVAGRKVLDGTYTPPARTEEKAEPSRAPLIARGGGSGKAGIEQDAGYQAQYRAFKTALNINDDPKTETGKQGAIRLHTMTKEVYSAAKGGTR